MMLFRGEAGGEWVPLGLGFGLRWGGGKGEEMKHQTPSESPTGVGDHRGLALGISPPPPEHRGIFDDDEDDEDSELPLGDLKIERGSKQSVYTGGYRQATEILQDGYKGVFKGIWTATGELCEL